MSPPAAWAEISGTAISAVEKHHQRQKPHRKLAHPSLLISGCDLYTDACRFEHPEHNIQAQSPAFAGNFCGCHHARKPEHDEHVMQMNEVRCRASGWRPARVARVAAMIDETGHPTGHLDRL